MPSISYKDPNTNNWVEIPLASDEVSIGTTAPTDENITLWVDTGNNPSGGITVDSELSTTSENPVQNKVINSALNGKQSSLSTAQLAAANSGITSAKVSTYDGYATNKVGVNTYATQTQYGIAKIWKDSDNYLCIRTDGN